MLTIEMTFRKEEGLFLMISYRNKQGIHITTRTVDAESLKELCELDSHNYYVQTTKWLNTKEGISWFTQANNILINGQNLRKPAVC